MESKETNRNKYTETKNTPFSNRLSSLLKEQGVSQADIATCIGKKPQAVSQYVNGISEPSLSSLVKIASRLHVSTDYLLGKSDIKTEDIGQQIISQVTSIDEDIIDTLITETMFRDRLGHVDLSKQKHELSESDWNNQLVYILSKHKLDLMKYALRWSSTLKAAKLEMHLSETCEIEKRLISNGIDPASPYAEEFANTAITLQKKGIHLVGASEWKEHLFDRIASDFVDFLRANYAPSCEEE